MTTVSTSLHPGPGSARSGAGPVSSKKEGRAGGWTVPITG